MKINNENFRTDLDNFFEELLNWKPRCKLKEPIIIIRPKEVYGVYYIKEVLTLPPKTILLKAWTGNYKSDVFSFTVKDIKEYIKTYKIEI